MTGLELDEHLAFQERQWRWERVGHILLGLIIIAALLGVFGTGPLASATAHSADGHLQLDYQRVVRHQGEAEYRLRIDPAAITGTEVNVWFATGSIHAVRVEGITPEPSAMETGADRLTMTFAVDPAQGPVTLVIHVTPQEMGLRTIELGLESGPSLRIRQLMLP